MNLQIEVFETKMFEGAVADEIVSALAEGVADRGVATLALSGGSTPASVYRMMTKPPRVEELAWSKVKVFVGDERWVPLDDPQSNFRMASESLFSGLPTPSVQTFPVNTAAATPAAAAKEYANTVRQHVAAESGIPCFDVVLLGIGEDGHTASIFPGSPLVSSSPDICCESVDGTGMKPRITLSKEVLFGARRVLFIIKGENKAAMVRRVIEGSDSPEVFPSRLFLGARHQVTFCLDTGAAKELSK